MTRSPLASRIPSDRGPVEAAREARLRKTALDRDGVALISLRMLQDAELRERIRAEALRQIGEVQPREAMQAPAKGMSQAEHRRRAEALFRSRS